jgi:hypothetical protein
MRNERDPYHRSDGTESRSSTFVLKIQGPPGSAGIRGLRWILKNLLRRHNFRCLDIREEGEGR